MLKRYFFLWLFVVCSSLYSYEVTIIKQESADNRQSVLIHSLYGQDVITEQVLIDLLEHAMMQRLKKIRQYGIAYYIGSLDEYTRFSHSVGVMLLVRRFGGSIEEQIAALLHDVSHTAFSHVADYVFREGDGKKAFQDEHHEWFLAQTGIISFLRSYGYADLFHEEDANSFLRLEQDLPDLCADRIEYNLHGAYLENVLTQQEVSHILSALRFEDGLWYFADQEAARLFAYAALHLTEHTFGSKENLFTYHHAARALKRAMEIGVVSKDDILFSYDDLVWDALMQSHDESIKSALACVLAHQAYSAIGAVEDHDLYIKGKFRGVNPWVKKNGEFMRLTVCDEAFRQEYERVKAFLNAGLYIKHTPFIHQ